jgi:hypothetical protein
MTIGLAAQAAWLIMHGEPVELATAASIRLYGPLSYAVGSWIAVTLARLWAKRREMWRDVFIFRRLTLPAIAAGIVGFAVVAFGVPIVTHWLSVTGGRSRDVRIDFHDARSVGIVMLFSMRN